MCIILLYFILFATNHFFMRNHGYYYFVFLFFFKKKIYIYIFLYFPKMAWRYNTEQFCKTVLQHADDTRAHLNIDINRLLANGACPYALNAVQ